MSIFPILRQHVAILVTASLIPIKVTNDRYTLVGPTVTRPVQDPLVVNSLTTDSICLSLNSSVGSTWELHSHFSPIHTFTLTNLNLVQTLLSFEILVTNVMLNIPNYIITRGFNHSVFCSIVFSTLLFVYVLFVTLASSQKQAGKNIKSGAKYAAKDNPLSLPNTCGNIP